MVTTSSKSRIGRFIDRFFGLRDNGSGGETLFVPINKIVGSVGRYHDFDAHFRPKGYDSDERLHGIMKKMREGRPMPPISLYQIKDSYYILDGHHRYAAARELGHQEIRSCILELLPSRDTFENRLYRERTEFRDRYHLHAAIELTEGTGTKLLGCPDGSGGRLVQDDISSASHPGRIEQYYPIIQVENSR
ncbi:MAG: ParB/RepB/Spo0J family partition protein [Desulfofustis sp.]